jgi:hypothetical protein
MRKPSISDIIISRSDAEPAVGDADGPGLPRDKPKGRCEAAAAAAFDPQSDTHGTTA